MLQNLQAPNNTKTMPIIPYVFILWGGEYFEGEQVHYIFTVLKIFWEPDQIILWRSNQKYVGMYESIPQ